MLELEKSHALGNDFVEAENVDVGRAPVDSYGVRRAWWALIVFEIQGLAAGIDIAIVSLLVHPLETAFRINDVGFATITATSFAIGFSVLQYPSGLVADILRRRDVIVAGSAIWALAALIAARADSGAMFFLARLLAGIGIGLTNPAILSMLGDAFPRSRRAFSMSIYMAGISIGIGVGLTICGALVEATKRNGTLHIGGILFSPWQQCFVVVAAIGAFALLLVLTLAEPRRMERSTRTIPNLASTLRILGQYLGKNWLLWSLLLTGNSIGAISACAIGTWGPAFGMRHYGITGVSAIALLGAFTAGGFLLGSIGGGLLAQHGINHGDARVLPRLLIAVAAVSCVFAAGFPYLPSWLLAVAGIGAVSATYMALQVLITIGVQETAQNEVRGQLYGLWNIVWFIPTTAGPTLVAFFASGVFAKAGGLGPAFAVVGGVSCVLSVVLFAFSHAPYERALNNMRALAASSQAEVTLPCEHASDRNGAIGRIT